MPITSDPSSHQAAERRAIAHALRLLDDPRLVLDTTSGRRAITTLVRDVSRGDHGVDVKRAMSALNVPDRALQERMPAGESIDVALSRRRFVILRQTVAHLRIVCTSPTRELIEGKSPRPMNAKDVEAFLKQLPAPPGAVPVTTVLVCTAGFTIESRELAQRTAQRTLILAEPNDAGGWSVYGPPETKALVDLFDPEKEDEKRRRIRAEIDAASIGLLTGGIASDRIAQRTQLPLQLVEAEVKSYAKATPGLAAKRLDGRVVLYREGSTPIGSAGAAAKSGAPSSSSLSDIAGGLAMPLIDRIRALFNRKGETEKKIAFLSERRAALSQQRDRAYEDITTLEGKDDELREQFKTARAPLTRRRITSQLVQLRKDLERRQQMIQVLNQQVNVVSTHLHNLELSQQGQAAQLPDSEEIASDAAAAEEMIAQLQADSELAESVAGVATAGMTDEEQALYEELERESGESAAAQVKLDHAEVEEPAPRQSPVKSPGKSPDAKPQAENQRRAEPEAS